MTSGTGWPGKGHGGGGGVDIKCLSHVSSVEFKCFLPTGRKLCPVVQWTQAQSPGPLVREDGGRLT